MGLNYSSHYFILKGRNIILTASNKNDQDSNIESGCTILHVQNLLF